MTEPVRVRFAPSPTGYPHVGNIRTALFNWLFARHMGGRFIVRIEDTDVARKVDDALVVILDSLRWLGLDWDEGPEVGGEYGPYFQSRRLNIYHEVINRLIERGNAYRCYCSPARLKEMREEQVRLKHPPGYDRCCRDLKNAERRKKEEEGITSVIRFKAPLQGQTKFFDLIRGEVVFENSTIDDLILMKSDGFPTYHLANVVDDHMMKVSHVMRAEEWLSSTPRHILMYQALGWQHPQFAHLPMILGADRAKLSKRHGAVSIAEFREKGYLPQTMINFLALLGWSLDDKTEILSRQDLVANFSLERVSKTGAILNWGKLDWMNGVYLRSLSLKDFLREALPFLEKGLPAKIDRPLSAEYICRIIPLIQERTKTLTEVVELSQFFFVDEIDYKMDLLIVEGMDAPSAFEALKVSQVRLEQLIDFNAESLEALLRPLAGELGLKTGQLFSTLRVTVTGLKAAPPLFQTMEVLGKERCMKRIKMAIHAIKRS